MELILMSDDFMLDELRERNMQRRIDNERERCALLAETLAMSYESRAKTYRKDGECTTRSLWPPFKKMTYVVPGIERSAKALDAAAAGLRVVALGCRLGWDPRTPDENERTAWGPCSRCPAPMDCGSWQSCERGLDPQEIAREFLSIENERIGPDPVHDKVGVHPPGRNPTVGEII
jgi:hypothetical protein